MKLPSIVRKIFLIVGLGAIFVAVSEFWFYPVSADVSHLGILLAYALVGLIFFFVVHTYLVRSFPHLFLAACLFGFLTEGAVVWMLYVEFPFSIIWTAMAWHALITIVGGWYLVRTLERHPALTQSLFYAGAGIFLGTWNTLLWNTLDSDSAELIWQWNDPVRFIEQFIFGFVLFVLGHVLYSLAKPSTLRFSKPEYLIPISLVFLWGLVTILPFLPISLILPVLLFACVYPLYRNNSVSTSKPVLLTYIDETPLRLNHYIRMLLVPLTAIPTYWTLVHYQVAVEWNAWLILLAGPISVWFFVRAWRTGW